MHQRVNIPSQNLKSRQVVIIAAPKKAIMEQTGVLAGLKGAVVGPKGGVAGGKNYSPIYLARDVRDTSALSHAGNIGLANVEQGHAWNSDATSSISHVLKM